PQHAGPHDAREVLRQRQRHAAHGTLPYCMLDWILHVDKRLTELVATYGPASYFILFVIIFAETGLVVTPFLPGDSLLFAAGALAATGAMRLDLLLLITGAAAILGNT